MKKAGRAGLPHDQAPAVLHDTSKWHPLGENQIRLVRLSPDVTTSITATLEIVDLDNPPPYCAVSYHWGEEPFDRVLQTKDGRPFKVTLSCQMMLTKLREHGLHLVWIDQLCVNQSDSAEKSEQVLLMNKIYSSATDIHVWLGLSTHDLDGILQFDSLAPILDLCADDYANAVRIMRKISVAYRSWLANPIPRTNNSGTERISEPRSAWAALANLLSCRYFQRRWIIQEVLLNSIVTVHIEAHEIPWTDLSTCCACIDAYRHGKFPDIGFPESHPVRTRSSAFARGIPNILIIESLRDYRSANAGITLLQLLSICRTFQTTLSIDTVYALRPLATDANLFPRPNYDSLGEDVFLSYALTMISQGHGTSLISQSGGIYAIERLKTKHSPVPSWLPDWEHTSRFFTSVNSTSSLSPALTPNQKISWGVHKKDQIVLHASILPLATIHATSCLGMQHNFATENSSFSHLFSIHRQWQTFAFQHCQSDLLEIATIEIIQTLLSHIRRSSTDWKDLLRSHISSTSVRDFYLQLLFLSPEHFDPTSPEGDDLWLEFIYGYNVRIVIGRNVLFATEDGHIGLAPQCASAGDMIGVIDGVDNMMVLRHRKKDQMFVLGDACFVSEWLAEPITHEHRSEGELLDVLLV